MRPVVVGTRAGLGVAALALLVLALPLLGAAFALGPGGLPHEAAFHAHASQDLSAAALDHIDRWLHGDFSVMPASGLLLAGAAPAGSTRRTVVAERAPTRATVSSAESERRL